LGEVDPADFTGAEAEARLKDLNWVGPRALRHEEVILSVMAGGPVLPVRFGAVFSSPSALADMLQGRRDAVTAFLRDNADREEWSVKVYLDGEKARAEARGRALADQAGALALLSPGARYLKEQRLRADAEKDVARRVRIALKDIVAALREDAVDFVTREPQARDVTGLELEMVLNGAFLVRRESVGRFHGTVDRIGRDFSDQGLTPDVTGPWPLYSFAPSLSGEGEA
jgi:hypothetical protein